MTNEISSVFKPTHFPNPTLIAVNGVELEVFEAGKQNAGKPIVLCHGFPEHAFSWRHQVSALVAAGYHVIIPNQRGYGNSSRPTEVTEYDIVHLTGDLVALLDYFDMKMPLLLVTIGEQMSFGAWHYCILSG
jgi:pimeloyl-ACP methyl ester carboxylesterase